MLKYIPMLIALFYVINTATAYIGIDILIDTLKELTDKEKRLSKYAACEYLNVSRATFDNYVREGKLPKGKHEIGFKELSWSKKDLDEFVRKSRDNHSLLNNVHNRVC